MKKGERGKGRQRESVVRKGEWSTLACHPVSPTVPSPRPHCQPRRSLINLIFNKPCDDAQGNAKTGNIQLSVKLITCQGGGARLLSLVGSKKCRDFDSDHYYDNDYFHKRKHGTQQRNDSHSTNVCISFDFK